jgi:peptidoglycan/LPS O-acetylase OafA/YrhL
VTHQLIYKNYINGIRALAVLSVVFFHAFPKSFLGGFVGVDIFYVISGYLISAIIYSHLETNQFSLMDFYSRRIRRLFPSLLLVLVSCYIFGWYALYAIEYKELGKHIAGSSGFVNNFVLMFDSGYFDEAQEKKPLLHLWSLAVEEQFYIVWPLILWFFHRQKWGYLTAICGLIGVSFIVNIFQVHTNPVVAFYSPINRGWELLLGALLAYQEVFQKDFATQLKLKYATWISSLGLCLIAFAVMAINPNDPYPGWIALLPTFGVVLLIFAGENSWVSKNILSTRILVWVGLISYPLYLWHWPLISFGQIVTQGKLSAVAIWLFIFLAFVLAYLSYRYVEKYLRYQSNKTAFVLLLLMLIIGFLGWNVWTRDGLKLREKHVINHYGGRPSETDQACLSMFQRYDPRFCRISNSNTKLERVLIGDSIAHNSYEGLAHSYQKEQMNFAMLGWPGMQPLLKQHPEEGYEINVSEKMNQLIQDLANNPDIKMIFLTMRQTQVSSDFKKQLHRTIHYIAEHQKQVIFIYPPPSLSFEPLDCVGLPPFRPVLNQPCVMNESDIEEKYFQERKQLMSELELLKVTTYDTYPNICRDKVCSIRSKDNLLYRNRAYLTTVGSEKVFENFKE